MRRSRLLSGLVFFSVLHGCADQTAILVEVTSSELRIPEDIDQLEIRAETDAGTMASVVAPIQGDWPHSVAIRPGSRVQGTVYVHVTGYRDGTARIRRVVSAEFEPGRKVRVEVELTEDCLGMICGSARQDCVAGECTVVEVDPDGGVEDAGMDSGPLPMDAGSDAQIDGNIPIDASDAGGEDHCAPESCNAADDDCDSSTDEGLPCVGNLVISEVAVAGPAGATDEFVELYNPTDDAIDISGIEIEYRAATSGEFMRRFTIPIGATIPAFGFYLSASSNYSRATVPDADDAWSSGFAAVGGHVRIVNGSTTLDLFGWGTASMPEVAAISAVSDEEVQTYERKANAASTAASMESGADVNAGNGEDTDNNQQDFVQRSAAGPQNISSAAEMPAG